MSTEATTAPGRAGPWPVLDQHECRALGVLVEKAKTTPDAYPMSLNALVTGSNQKSNRDPVLELDEWEVEEALRRCKDKGLVSKVIGGRVERYKHLLYETWHVNKVELAILAELLLRTAQTEGELRTRASRMEPIDDLDALRECLKPLLDRNLVLYLTPEGRGAVLTHGFHDKHALERLRNRHRAGAAAAAAVAPVPSSSAASTAPSYAPPHAPAPAAPRPDPRVDELVSAVGALRQELAAVRQELSQTAQQAAALQKVADGLRAELATTQTELRGLKLALGG